MAKLPGLMGVAPASDENPDQLTHFSMRIDVKYEDMLHQFLDLTHKGAEYNQKQNAKDQSDKVKATRQFAEIRSQADFDKYCTDKKKGCAIALLNAMEIIDYEKRNHKEHIETMQKLDEAAGGNPIYYMWINVTCHENVLSHFNIDRMAVPTMVYYHPKHNKYGWLVGRFEEDALKTHETSFLGGKLPLRPVSEPPTIIEKDCKNIQPEIIT